MTMPNFPAPLRTQKKPSRRCYRLQHIPSDVTLQTLQEQIQKRLPGSTFQITSLCSHSSGRMKTALITFPPPPPQDFHEGIEIQINEHKIRVESCHNITVLYEPPVGVPVQADILFVHGLGGHSIGSWTTTEGHCWPRDDVGQDLKNVRVLTFGYEAKLNQDTSTSRLSDFGAALRNQILVLRRTSEHRTRPLFLVGHSFGGTVITWLLQDLFRKRDRGPEYDLTFRAIQCVTFFGVPLEGMSIQSLEPITDARDHDAMRRTLGDIQEQSELLNELRTSLAGFQGINFITCEEQKLTKARDSKGRLTEAVIPIYADHQEMVKFSGHHDSHYEQILYHMEKNLKLCHKVSDVKYLDSKQRKMLLKSLQMSHLGAEHEAYRKTEEGSAWLFETTQYRNWYSGNSEPTSMCLSITGPTGSGRSTLLDCALRQQLQHRNDDHHVISFFFSNYASESQNSIKKMYQSLLFQLVENSHRVPCELYVLDQLSSGSTWQTVALRRLLECLIPIQEKPVFCFIDTTECQHADTPDTISFFDGIAEKCGQKTAFRLCLTSNIDSPSPTKFPKLDVIAIHEHEGHQRDILRFADSQLQLGLFRNYIQELAQKSKGNFLWASLAVEILKKDFSQGGRNTVIERISELPSGVSEICNYILKMTCDLGTQASEKFLLLLRYVHEAREPPKAEKCYKATMYDSSRSTNAVVDFFKHKPRSTDVVDSILQLSMGLLDMTGKDSSRVRFVHSSIPELLQTLQTTKEACGSNSTITPVQTHERTKRDCLDILVQLDAGAVDHETATFAIENIIPSANEAQRGGIPQADFFVTFPLPEWIGLANEVFTHSKFHPSASMMYVLAELNMADLILVHPEHRSYLNPEPDMRSTPLFAALVKMNREAILAFLQIERNRLSDNGFLEYHRLSRASHEELCTHYMHTLQHSYESGAIANTLMRRNEPLTDYSHVIDFMSRSENGVLYLFLMLSGHVEWDKLTYDRIEASLEVRQPHMIEYGNTSMVPPWTLQDEEHHPENRSRSQGTRQITETEYYDSGGVSRHRGDTKDHLYGKEGLSKATKMIENDLKDTHARYKKSSNLRAGQRQRGQHGTEVVSPLPKRHDQSAAGKEHRSQYRNSLASPQPEQYRQSEAAPTNNQRKPKQAFDTRSHRSDQNEGNDTGFSFPKISHRHKAAKHHKNEKHTISEKHRGPYLPPKKPDLGTRIIDKSTNDQNHDSPDHQKGWQTSLDHVPLTPSTPQDQKAPKRSPQGMDPYTSDSSSSDSSSDSSSSSDEDDSTTEGPHPESNEPQRTSNTSSSPYPECLGNDSNHPNQTQIHPGWGSSTSMGHPHPNPDGNHYPSGGNVHHPNTSDSLPPQVPSIRSSRTSSVASLRSSITSSNEEDSGDEYGGGGYEGIVGYEYPVAYEHGHESSREDIGSDNEEDEHAYTAQGYESIREDSESDIDGEDHAYTGHEGGGNQPDSDTSDDSD